MKPYGTHLLTFKDGDGVSRRWRVRVKQLPNGNYNCFVSPQNKSGIHLIANVPAKNVKPLGILF